MHQHCPAAMAFQIVPNLYALCPVRCISCDGSGQASAVTAALDWLAGNVQLPAIASMSLGAGQPDSVLNAATTAILALGVTVVTAAGNYNDGKEHVSLPCLMVLSSSAVPSQHIWPYLRTCNILSEAVLLMQTPAASAQPMCQEPSLSQPLTHRTTAGVSATMEHV